METQRLYDAEVTALTEKILQQQKEVSPGVFRTCSRLRKIARKRGDDELLGFAYYQTADAYYIQEVSYEKYKEYLKKTIFHLQRAGISPLLARAYNLVGVDASNNGSFDVAYYYYRLALDVAETLADSYLTGIVNANIAQVHWRMGNHALARKVIRMSNRELKHGDENDIYFHHNMINGYFVDAILSIELNDIAAAERLDKKISAIEKKTGGKGISGVAISVLFLRTQMAFMRGDRVLFEQRLNDMTILLSRSHQLFDYTAEIQQICNFLLANKELHAVRRILDIVRRKADDTGIIQMMRMVTRLETAYYRLSGNAKMAAASLRESYALNLRQEEEQRKIYLYSIELIRLLDDLRKEQEKLRSENLELMVQSHTDPLTGIPNRLMLDKRMEHDFSNASREGRLFGVAILDVDKFKEYNDTYGHGAGDVCLQRIAETIAAVSKEVPGMFCARYGGDEFVLLFNDMTDREIRQAAKRLEKAVAELEIPHKETQSGVITISQGICNGVPVKETRVHDFLRAADRALYIVKKKEDAKERTGKIRFRHL